MCITYTSNIQKTEKDLIAFKLVLKDDVKKDKFYSYYPSNQRIPQSGRFRYGNGKDLAYEIGKPTISKMPRTPGLYMYKHQKRLRFPSTSCILRVKIPAGTKVRFGVDGGGRRHCICAGEIIPLKVTRAR